MEIVIRDQKFTEDVTGSVQNLLYKNKANVQLIVRKNV